MDNKWYEKMEDYLSKKMSPEEQLLFESELRENEEIEASFKIYKEIEDEMHIAEEDDKNEAALKSSLKKWTSVFFKGENLVAAPAKKEELPEADNKVKKMKFWKMLAIAASVAGVTVLGIALYFGNIEKKSPVAVNTNGDSAKNIVKPDTTQLKQQNIPPENIAKQEMDTGKKVIIKKPPKLTTAKRDALFAANFKPDTAPDEQEGPLEDAFISYEDGNYEETINDIETADLNSITRAGQADSALTAFYASYYKGLSYLAQENAAKAIPELKNAVSESPEKLSQIKAQWYLALAYLKIGDVRRAKELLNEVVENRAEREYKMKAKNLLKELKR